MATWAEVSTWSNDEIVQKVRELLPEGWQFKHLLDVDGAFRATIVDVASGLSQWSDEQADERLILLNAYGWLFVRKPTARNPRWVRGEITVPVAQQTLPTVITPQPDPEDLDPEEIDAVYSSGKSK